MSEIPDDFRKATQGGNLPGQPTGDFNAAAGSLLHRIEEVIIDGEKKSAGTSPETSRIIESAGGLQAALKAQIVKPITRDFPLAVKHLPSEEELHQIERFLKAKHPSLVSIRNVGPHDIDIRMIIGYDAVVPAPHMAMRAVHAPKNKA